MILYLIRHGRTVANERKLYCGSSNLPLSDGGRAQLAQLHYEIPKARFLTSGMKRTDDTLKLLFGDVPFCRDPDFREVDFGIFELHSYEQLKNRPAYIQWITGDNEANIPPHGESGVEMRRRVLKALERIKEDTVLITHGGVIAVIMDHLFPEEGKTRYQWQPENGRGYLVDTQRHFWKAL